MQDEFSTIRDLLPRWCWRVLAVPAVLFAWACTGAVVMIAIAAPILLPFAILAGIGMGSAIRHLAFPEDA